MVVEIMLVVRAFDRGDFAASSTASTWQGHHGDHLRSPGRVRPIRFYLARGCDSRRRPSGRRVPPGGPIAARIFTKPPGPRAAAGVT
jgi:hypothetical protein